MKLSLPRIPKNRPRKYRITRFARWLEKTLQYVWGRKSWILTYSVAIATVYYVGRIGRDKDPIENSQQYELKKRQYLEDVAHVDAISEEYNELTNSIKLAVHYTDQVTASISKKEIQAGNTVFTVDTQKAQLGLDASKKCRTKIAFLLAALKGTRFQTEAFMDFHKGWEEEVRELDKTLSYCERLCKGALASNASEMATGLRQIEGQTLRFQEAIETMNQRAKEFEANTNNILKKAEIEKDTQDRNDITRGVQGLIIIFMFFLTVFLGVLAFKGQQTQKLSTPMLGGRPDLAKTQRQKYQAMRANRRQQI